MALFRFIVIPLILILIVAVVFFLIKRKISKSRIEDSSQFAPPPIQQWTADTGLAGVPPAAGATQQQHYITQESYGGAQQPYVVQQPYAHDMEKGHMWQDTVPVHVSWSLGKNL
jgi:hypothetical protein